MYNNQMFDTSANCIDARWVLGTDISSLLPSGRVCIPVAIANGVTSQTACSAITATTLTLPS